MQRERRRDPYPWTWEPPAAAILITLLVMLIGIQLGRAVANLLAGAGWTWPQSETVGGFSSPLGTTFWTSLPGVVAGHADAGLIRASSVAGPRLLWGGIVVTELVLLAALIWSFAHLYMRWGPSRMRGMASPGEAEKTLGVTRLRKVAPIVRPDLYGKHAPTQQPVPVETAPSVDQPGPELGRGLSPWLLERHTTKENR